MTVTSRYITLNFYVPFLMFAPEPGTLAREQTPSRPRPFTAEPCTICSASILGCRAPSRERAEAIYVHMHRVRCICHDIDIVPLLLACRVVLQRVVIWPRSRGVDARMNGCRCGTARVQCRADAFTPPERRGSVDRLVNTSNV